MPAKRERVDVGRDAKERSDAIDDFAVRNRCSLCKDR
jgi:hypothetical protein